MYCKVRGDVAVENGYCNSLKKNKRKKEKNPHDIDTKLFLHAA